MGPKQEFFIQSAKYYFYYFCIGMAQTIFLHRQIQIFYHGIFSFSPCGHSSPNVNLTSSTPMRSSTLQEGRQSWSNKVKGMGYGENNIRDGKFTSAWVSIMNFFRHIKVRHGPQIICRCRRQRRPSVNNYECPSSKLGGTGWHLVICSCHKYMF
jgi:hypothetical protein